MTKEFEGQIMLCRSSGLGDDFHLRLTDNLSRCVVVDVRIEPKDIADLMSTHHTACRFQFNDSGVIGMTAENKTEIVGLSKETYKLSDDDIQTLLAPFEIDGWKGRKSDITNHHRHGRDAETGVPFSAVTFTRHVPTKKAAGDE